MLGKKSGRPDKSPSTSSPIPINNPKLTRRRKPQIVNQKDYIDDLSTDNDDDDDDDNDNDKIKSNSPIMSESIKKYKSRPKNNIELSVSPSPISEQNTISNNNNNNNNTSTTVELNNSDDNTNNNINEDIIEINEVTKTKRRARSRTPISEKNLTPSQMVKIKLNKITLFTDNQNIPISDNNFEIILKSSKFTISSSINLNFQIHLGSGNIKEIKFPKDKNLIPGTILFIFQNDVKIILDKKSYYVEKLLIQFQDPTDNSKLKLFKRFLPEAKFMPFSSQESIKYFTSTSLDFKPSSSETFYGTGIFKSSNSSNSNSNSNSKNSKNSKNSMDTDFSSLSRIPKKKLNIIPTAPESRRSNRRGAIIKYENEDSEDEKANEKMVSENGDILPNEYTSENDQLIFEPNLKFKFDNKKTFTITNDDFKCLYNGNWINDTLVDFFLNYHLKLSIENKIPKSNNIEILNSFFFTSLSRPREDLNYYMNVKSWFKLNDTLFDKDFVIIPIMQDLHWYFVVITDLKYLKKKHMKLKLLKENDQIDNFNTINSDSDNHEDNDDKDNSNNTNLKIVDNSQSQNLDNTNIYLNDLSISQNKDDVISIDEEESPLYEDDKLPNISNNESKSQDFQSSKNLKSADEKITGVVQICILDSLYRNHEREILLLKDFIIGYAAEKYDFEIKSNEIIKHKCFVPRQNNFNDCGLHLVMNVETMLSDPIIFNKKVLKRSPKGFRQTLKMKKENEMLFNPKKMLNIREDLRNLLLKLLKDQVTESGGDSSKIGTLTAGAKKLQELNNLNDSNSNKIGVSGNINLSNKTTNGSSLNLNKNNSNLNASNNDNHDNHDNNGDTNDNDNDNNDNNKSDNDNNNNNNNNNIDYNTNNNGNDDDEEDDDLMIIHAEDKEPIHPDLELSHVKPASIPLKNSIKDDNGKRRGRPAKKKQMIVKLELSKNVSRKNLENFEMKNNDDEDDDDTITNLKPVTLNKSVRRITRGSRKLSLNSDYFFETTSTKPKRKYTRRKIDIKSVDKDKEKVMQKSKNADYDNDNENNNNGGDDDDDGILSQDSYHAKDYDAVSLKMLESDYETVDEIGAKIDKEINEPIIPKTTEKSSSEKLMDDVDCELYSSNYNTPLSPINLSSEGIDKNDVNDNSRNRNISNKEQINTTISSRVLKKKSQPVVIEDENGDDDDDDDDDGDDKYEPEIHQTEINNEFKHKLEDVNHHSDKKRKMEQGENQNKTNNKRGGASHTNEIIMQSDLWYNIKNASHRMLVAGRNKSDSNYQKNPSVSYKNFFQEEKKPLRETRFGNASDPAKGLEVNDAIPLDYDVKEISKNHGVRVNKYSSNSSSISPIKLSDQENKQSINGDSSLIVYRQNSLKSVSLSDYQTSSVKSSRRSPGSFLMNNHSRYHPSYFDQYNSGYSYNNNNSRYDIRDNDYNNFNSNHYSSQSPYFPTNSKYHMHNMGNDNVNQFPYREEYHPQNLKSNFKTNRFLTKLPTHPKQISDKRSKKSLGWIDKTGNTSTSFDPSPEKVNMNSSMRSNVKNPLQNAENNRKYIRNDSKQENNRQNKIIENASKIETMSVISSKKDERINHLDPNAPIKSQTRPVVPCRNLSSQQNLMPDLKPKDTIHDDTELKSLKIKKDSSKVSEISKLIFTRPWKKKANITEKQLKSGVTKKKDAVNIDSNNINNSMNPRKRLNLGKIQNDYDLINSNESTEMKISGFYKLAGEKQLNDIDKTFSFSTGTSEDDSYNFNSTVWEESIPETVTEEDDITEVLYR
ncbi:hypothetical protein C6P40_002889 [Pichia californica]|uniref:Ubiquitin-like protease family profile domain-containing protein n=1 Tax=Pichia californica TaxID=460514 RepID=A0A9P6WHK1_9ASCO|nr:hypothetical protein C6P40_002889 [[Candida] californica]